MLPELQAKAAQPRLHLQVQAERQSWRGATRAHTTAAAGTRKIQKAAEHVVRQCVHATSKEKKAALFSFLFPPEEHKHVVNKQIHLPPPPSIYALFSR
jgi:hypothetical protein